MNNYKEFSRQPRMLPDFPRGEIEVTGPPSEQSKPEISWAGILFPPVIMGVITILIALSMKSIFMMVSIVMTGITLIGSLTNAARQIKKYKKYKNEREKKYLQYIVDCRGELLLAREQQIKALSEMHPEPSICVKRIESFDNKLWEKTSAFGDFLNVRIGIGNAPLNLKVNYSKQAFIMETDPLLKEPEKLAEEFKQIGSVPLAVDLIGSQITGIVGAHEKANELVMMMILQLVAHHGYDDLRVVILTKEENQSSYRWLRYVPHSWNNEMDSRYILCGKAMAHQTLSELNSIFQDRELKQQRNGLLPFYLFIVEDESLLDNEVINQYIYNCSGKLGVLSVFITENQAYLPMNCNVMIRLNGKSGEFINRLTGQKSVFSVDMINPKVYESIGLSLACLRLKSKLGTFEVPKSVTLNELYGISTIEELNIHQRWTNNKTYQGLSVPIGCKAGKKVFSLDLHETGHGPHGLVAGTTGSGKSEVLQTMIISLAMNYHPHDLVFVLIDYKGGGMADVFKEMPHLVGTITNLGGNQTIRALLSIKSELKRRQRIFSQFGVNNIDKYQKLFYQNTLDSMPQVPHLIMIADEFAELKQDQPEFMKELVSAARVGRSLGIHLILATQKPAGVVDDQIWSNSKFKLCLKVQNEADSNDVIKKPDAAFLKEPGRAYIQVGNDELFELFQVAYSGADYHAQGTTQITVQKPKRLYQIALNGKAEKIYPFVEEKLTSKEVPSQLKAMVEFLNKIAVEQGIQPLVGPWMPPLEEEISFDSIKNEVKPWKWERKINSNDICRVPVGMMDYPQEQVQQPISIDFANEGNLIVYGASGSGKSYLLRIIALSLSMKYSPEEVALYIMDLGGGNLKKLASLPHCGGVVQFEEESKIGYLIQYIAHVIEERKELFLRNNVDNFIEYRERIGIMNSMIIFIDNYFALAETYQTFEEKILCFMRDGNRYGIYFVLTSSNTTLIRYRVVVNFKQFIAFQMTDKSDLVNIVGRLNGLDIQELPGRGLIKHNPPFEIQIVQAEYDGLGIEDLINETINQVKYTGHSNAKTIPMMEEHLDIIQMNQDSHALTIGKEFQSLQPVSIDFTSPSWIIAGDLDRNPSRIFLGWFQAISQCTNEKKYEFYGIDSSNMELFHFVNHEDVVEVKLSEDLKDIIEELEAKMQLRKQQLIEMKKSSGNCDLLMQSWKQIIIVINKLDELTNSSQYNLIDFLENAMKTYKGLKLTLIILDEISNLSSNWSTLGKAIREEQTGILLGTIKDQNLFDLRLPFGTIEREMGYSDGYIIQKNRYQNIRFAN